MPQLTLIDSSLELAPASLYQINSTLHSKRNPEHLLEQSNPVSDRGLQELELDLEAVNQRLTPASASQIVEWASETFGDGLVMSTSFGIQAAVMLHLATRILPDLPVIWVDTGYLPAETYIFAEQLTERLNLNLKVYQSPISPARMEALYGRLWANQELDSLNRYDQMRKVEPMQRALQELKATAWLAGLRRDQTNHRKNLQKVARQGELYKVHPILDWHSRDIYQYLTAHNLPYHPFFDQGYVTVGDWHSSRPLTADDTDERVTRFHGVKQECGLHLPLTTAEAKSLDSSTL
jgi:phosphoadenosine phosphosulfate reductase